jgi:DNA polymerase sigma
LYVFGSSASYLFEPNSDIDFCLSLPDFYKTSEVDAIKALAKLLKSKGVWHTLCLLKARVPIIKLLSTGRVFHKTFDLCVNRNLVGFFLFLTLICTKGVQNSRLIRAYADSDPRVRPLAMVLKKWSKVVKVYNPSSAFSSYCIYLLLIFFLQTRPEPVLPNLQARSEEIIYLVDGYNCHFDAVTNWKSTNTESLGQLLCKFFLYFWQFDYKHYAISIRLGKLIPKSSCDFVFSPIAVEDPFETGKQYIHSNFAYSNRF